MQTLRIAASLLALPVSPGAAVYAGQRPVPSWHAPACTSRDSIRCRRLALLDPRNAIDHEPDRSLDYLRAGCAKDDMRCPRMMTLYLRDPAGR